ncbi:MAG: PilZ domain-containing protein [Zoogloeaceae bacterium]|jgi:hypothetical protein|nr:PilZ domain-containing protein [Zoogloeaceae bacterium]
MESNRRRFSRIQFSALAELSLGDEQYVVTVLDISLRGALVQAVEKPLPKLVPGASCTLAINLGDEVSQDLLEGGILMEAVVAHVRGDIFGLRCVEIDLESITNLRLIVEFNLGDEAILSRELEYLSHEE